MADIMRGCLRHIETGTLPNDGASDYSWDVVMMGQKNLLGQLETVKKMQDARERRDRAGGTCTHRYRSATPGRGITFLLGAGQGDSN